MKTIQNWSEIPEFEDEAAEAAFWAKHSLDARLMNASLHRQNVRESTTITLRFDPQMLSMIKQWLSERLEDEISRQDD